ncbi:TraB/GumN family protein [Pseudoalteromonas sp. SG45-5]|uniref:TraB/GumN family protein n=1 Tax=unclassified Pseudoalteromonas TaxID=194690 RepID=UPI0015FA670F|nr:MULTISPECIES: TraB/GumN family protein [unclassified Pseudoalteromonas]MBB1385418.1 TraB/GumN family protein [Pseudoalteromonas sp. SG45-5]MBB1393392.1 TraB/GumN family protein [Pseudoalteromonas sp. SG44-4]MBB1447861.1 TraB/GumN family protein [Pseudoalteromonas sp. SG41-6]
MKVFTKNILSASILLSSCLITSFAHAQSSVWQVSKGGDSLFIGGTIHILPKSEMPLPIEFNHAYELADTIILETKLPNPTDTKAQMEMLSALSYTNNEKLSQRLSPDVKQQLESKLAEFGANLIKLDSFRPAMMSIVLMSMELQKQNLVGEGVDAYFSRKATEDSKSQQYLETMDFQLQLFKTMGQDNENKFIKYNLDELGSYGNMFKTLVSAWRSGNTKILNSVAIEKMQKDDPHTYKQLITDRNNDWLPKVEAMFNNDKNEFVLVGVAHLAGQDSLLTLLENKGYSVSLVSVDNTVDITVKGAE